MSTSSLSKEAETRLMNFFNETIDPKDMAKAIRHINYVLTLGIMSEDEMLQNEVANLRGSFYWLNELAEVLSPYLDEE